MWLVDYEHCNDPKCKVYPVFWNHFKCLPWNYFLCFTPEFHLKCGEGSDIIYLGFIFNIRETFLVPGIRAQSHFAQTLISLALVTDRVSKCGLENSSYSFCLETNWILLKISGSIWSFFPPKLWAAMIWPYAASIKQQKNVQLNLDLTN